MVRNLGRFARGRVGYAIPVSRAPWTYELPAAGGETGGLEEYVVYAADGEPVGKVTVVLQAEDDLYVVVDRGEPP